MLTKMSWTSSSRRSMPNLGGKFQILEVKFQQFPVLKETLNPKILNYVLVLFRDNTDAFTMPLLAHL